MNFIHEILERMGRSAGYKQGLREVEAVERYKADFEELERLRARYGFYEKRRTLRYDVGWGAPWMDLGEKDALAGVCNAKKQESLLQYGLE
jgi:hypothetical protein